MAQGDLRDHLVAYFEDHHKFLEAGALQLLLKDHHPLLLSRQLLEGTPTDSPFVTQAMVEAMIARRAVSTSSGVAGFARLDTAVRSPASARVAAEPFTLIAEGFNEPNAAIGPLGAFESLFLSRYRALHHLLSGRPDLPNVRSLSELRADHGAASVIVMIREVRQTAERKHLILQVEDESGSAELLVPRDSPAAHEPYVSDEVIGATIVFPRERGRLPRVQSVQRPDVPRTRVGGRASRPSRVLFISDLHIGSRSFLDRAWDRLSDFLYGRGPAPELAAEIRHVVIAGDLVDGIGVYPKQERDLAIEDIFEQYAELGRRLAQLPNTLNIIAVPGNHDAVCPAEPQPNLPAKLREQLPRNVRSLGNPSTFALDGVVIEAYHGRSFDDLIPALPGASYARPTEVMKRMLAMRHLAPIYGERTPLAPLPRDGLVIDPAPDILVTGHAHTYGVDQHRGVLLLNASTWQAETEYQRMRNISPVPARAAVVDLTSLRLHSLDFSSEVPRVNGPPN